MKVKSIIESRVFAGAYRIAEATGPVTLPIIIGLVALEVIA